MSKFALIPCWIGIIALLPFIGSVQTTQADGVADCNQLANPDLKIRGCTKLLEGTELNGDEVAYAYNNRGNAYLAKGAPERAISDHNFAITNKWRYADAYFNRGNAYYSKGDVKQAIADYKKAIEIKPDYAAAYANRSIAYRQRGKSKRADADCEKAKSIDADIKC